ncbi:Zn-ribbon domain-containing OB-fold protein [Sphingobium sp.]|uniref:Zn-ribbon domain-containing OB-fold protein n=1 Tax=Sphingobium sp. TaxID=1912891 RepID=UPI0028BF4743|nr:zinc ribbon domain-containing protein [Sphingobium sp.]
MVPAPDVEERKAYDEALMEGRLLVRHCNACDAHHHYPRSYCPFCGSGDTDWTVAAGTGHVYTLTRWRQRDKVVVAAYVTLPEGPSVLSLIVGDDAQGLTIGDEVRLAATQGSGSMPSFACTNGEQDRLS